MYCVYTYMFSNLSCIQPLSFGFWVFWFKWIKNYHFQPEQERAFDHHPVNTRCHNTFPHHVFCLKPLQTVTRDSNSWTISGYLHLLSIFPKLFDNTSTIFAMCGYLSMVSAPLLPKGTLFQQRLGCLPQRCQGQHRRHHHRRRLDRPWINHRVMLQDLLFFSWQKLISTGIEFPWKSFKHIRLSVNHVIQRSLAHQGCVHPTRTALPLLHLLHFCAGNHLAMEI